MSPATLQFRLPRDEPATLTLTSKTGTTVTATTSNATCTVTPASVTLVKPQRGAASYTGTLTVAPSGTATAPGGCTVTLTDKKGGQVPVAVTFAASEVRLRQATVATGTYHSCALDAGGAAWCWGFNQYGSLGDGTTTSRSTPAPVSGSLTFTSLTAGALHTCGLTAAGTAHCWGVGIAVGDGANTDRTTPTPVSGGLVFIQLAASGLRTCGITAAGQAYCWGRNSEGQLGDGTNEDRLVPTAVANVVGGAAGVFAVLEAGAAHTCGLTGGGKAYCWGYGNDGQTGDGAFNSGSRAPKAVTGGLAFTELTGRSSSTCGLSAAALYCWGHNGAGQLGNGTTTPQASPTAAQGGPFAALGAGSTPTPETTAGTHACALTAAGAAYCWGLNTGGQLGDGSLSNRTTPTAVTGPAGGAALAFEELSTGALHTCGRTTDDAIYCWGENNFGQLGSGGGQQSTPTFVSVGGTPGITSVSLASTTIPIEGSTNYDAVLLNPGTTTLTGVALQGYIMQGGATVSAAGTVIECSGTYDGLLPPGSCTSSGTVSVSNTQGGGGTLVPGAATYRLELIKGTTVLDSESVGVVLQ